MFPDMKKGIFSVVMACFLLITACGTKEERQVRSLQQFVAELQSKADKYSDEDWQKAFQEYASITENLQKGRFTEEERREIGRLKGQCWAVFTQYTFDALGRELRNSSAEFSGVMEGFMKSFDASAEESLDDFAEALGEIMECFGTQDKDYTDELIEAIEGAMGSFGSEAE